MNVLVAVACFVTFQVVAGGAAATGAPLEVAVRSGTSAEVQTRDQLLRLLREFDVSKWIFTDRVLIDERSIPHSHPVLTLFTRYTDDDDLLIATFLHEQIHWYLVAKQAATNDAIADLKALFPAVPIGGRAGARNEYSTYLHLVVCYLEWRVTESVLGEQRARRAMEFFTTSHYTWVYRTVLARGAEIERILVTREILPIER
jgi:hypothetical protein